MTIRLGAVSFLNARPLVRGLERHPDRFSIRFDLPNRCAALLHAGDIDVGLLPSIEYLNGDYRLVPGIGVVSDGAVASVALFARRPIQQVRSIALDTTSRTSAALVRVLCRFHFEIAPVFVPAAPDLAAMVRQTDAALLIGDPALFADPASLGLEKIDLGVAWKELTGLPFVYAFWAGHPGALTPADVARLAEARDRGRREAAAIAREACPDDPAKQALVRRYLHENVLHHVGERERLALERFYDLAVQAGAAPAVKPIRPYDAQPLPSPR
jgi:chorismate dehydratase